jgi:predicted kinase
MSGVLVVLAGVPGTGKATLPRGIATNLPGVYLRVDAAETALEGAAPRIAIGAAGYAVVHAPAAENLALSIPVVVDAVNPVPDARAGWRALASPGT